MFHRHVDNISNFFHRRSEKSSLKANYTCKEFVVEMKKTLRRGRVSVVVLAEILFHPLAGFGGERRKIRRIKIRFLCSLGADCGSQQLKLLDVPEAPETDPEMQLDVDPLANGKPPLHGFRHDSDRVLAGWQPAQQPPPD